MKLAFLELLADERRLYFEQAAAQRNISPIILEKDFWVCWMLGLLFRSDVAPNLVFKGGTSLSKVFNVIERFSEDIDLSLAPSFLGISEAEVEHASSKTQREKWMERLEAHCSTAIEKSVQPTLEQLAINALGARDDNRPWFTFEVDEATNSPVLYFHYPTDQPQGFEYLRRAVKLEFGSLTDQRPIGQHPVRPWIADIFRDSFTDWECQVTALEVERTFWEKATILHAEYHRPTSRATPDRFSRHYADTASLAVTGVADNAVTMVALRERVVAWKRQFFGSSWARYDLAKPGSFRLIPPEARLPPLKLDYDKMRDMYLSEPTPFNEVINILTDLEKRINQ